MTTFDFTDRPYIKAAAERTRAEIDRLNNPHTFHVENDRLYGFIVLNTQNEWVNSPISYDTHDEASDAIGAMIADDDADRRLNRNRHESMGDR